MDFFTIILLLCLYYVRPHEWIGIFKALPMVKITFLLGIVALFHKHRGLRFREILQTPQDWMMFFFFTWVVLTASTHYATFRLILPLYGFYYVVPLVTLDNPRRMLSFLSWWAFFIVVLAALAVASQYGFDPTESYDLTMGHMKGRLAFNTSIFNNANALGHSVVPVIVMLYFIGFWKRPAVIKMSTAVIMLLPIYCVWLTVSKGSFLTGFATLLIAVTFRRPLGMQILIIATALSLGVVAVQMLPRMEELNEAKSNQAIQGRVAAFRFGMEMVDQKMTGVGWANFENELFRHLHFQKAPHCSYVRVGGELGFPGLFLFMGIIYCSLRTLLFAHTENEDEERIRRILFVMIISYAVSSWMVGWSDRGTFYMMVAAVSAFHRYMQNRESSTLSEVGQKSDVYVSESPLSQPPPQPAFLPTAAAMTRGALTPPPAVATPASDLIVQPALVQLYLEKIAGIKWRRVGWVDLVLIFCLTTATYMFWDYIMKKM